jgi:RNA polymerase sigma-70 factor (ECF subfamily)
MNMDNLSDNELWDEVTTDEPGAFVILYNRHWKKLFRTASFYLKDPAYAEEIVHDVFVVLWERRKHLKITNFQSYLVITARYHIYKKLKAAKISPIEYVEEYKDLAADQTDVSTTQKLVQEDFETELKVYLSGVPKRCSEIFLLSRVNHLSNTEIATFLGISRCTVENQITHALKYLRNQFSKKPSL